MIKLNGEMRVKIIVQWIQRGGKAYMDKETFVKKVCEAKGIEYVEPPEYKNGNIRE